MDPTQNQPGASESIFSSGAAPTNSNSGDIILQPSYSPSSAPRSKKPIVIAAIALVILVIAIIIVAALGNSGEKPIDESKVKPAAYSYINYLVYGEDSNEYKDINEALSGYYTFLPIDTSPFYADSMLYKDDKKTYFETLDTKLDDLITAYEEAYGVGMEFEALRKFYLEFAMVANNPGVDMSTRYMKNGIGSLDNVENISTDSSYEDIVKYVEISNEMRKIYIAGVKNAYENGCYINYDASSDTATESIPGCFSEINFNSFGAYDENYATKFQLEESFKKEAIEELNNLIGKFYNNED